MGRFFFYWNICDFQAVMALLDEETTADVDRLRLVMLYCLRYEKDSSRQIEAMMKKLTSKPSKFKPAVILNTFPTPPDKKEIFDFTHVAFSMFLLYFKCYIWFYTFHTSTHYSDTHFQF